MKYALFLTGTLLLAACVPSQPHSMGGGMQHGQGMMGGGSFLPAQDKDVRELPEAKPSEILEIKDGDTITLNPELVQKTINRTPFAMYGYNGQFPGPTLTVKQGSTFTVNVTNNIDLPTTVHWHGIRLENKFDGAAGVTQDAVEPGDSFTYTVTVPDEGLFWYHPHVREDLQQDMGLYGLLHVTPSEEDAYPLVDREEYVVLDDVLLDNDATPVPYGAEEADHALMGRFGDMLFINGDNSITRTVQRGDRVRFAFLNAANTRTFRVRMIPSGPGQHEPLRMKLVGDDAGRYAQETWIEELTIAPSERRIVDVQFGETGIVDIVHEPSLDDPRRPPMFLGHITVGGASGGDASFATLGNHDIGLPSENALVSFRSAEPDHTLHLSVESQMASMMMQSGMQHGNMEHGSEGDGIEWEDPMPHMNAMATKGNTQWKLIDDASGAENMEIAYKFTIGDKVKIRIVNDTEEDGSDHPMQHPIHFHGQRFLVLSVDGKPNENLVWKDTVLVEKNQTVDILLDVTNPGDWMIHCHIAEHLSNGMMGLFHVQP